jgi:hypothetical protein
VKEIDQKYEEVIKRLQKGERALTLYSNELEQQLVQGWSIALENKDDHQLKKILCLVDRSERYLNNLAPLYIKTFLTCKSEENLIFALGSVSRQLIQAQARLGERPPGELILSLGHLLDQNPKGELLEWVLRVLEEMGTQSIMVKEKVLKLRPGLSRYFDQHSKHAYELITLLEQRWSHLSGPISRGSQ